MNRQLRRSLALTLVFKLVALIALWAFFFSPSHRFKPTTEDMLAHFSSAAPY